MASPTPSDCLMVEDPEDTVPLSEILAVRDKCLHEEELWALCRECCLLLEYVQDSEEMFQAVSITPETIGFDSQGNLCFLYLDSTDPEPLFLPPETEDGSDKDMASHLYSLGMTMLYAAEYNVQLGSVRERERMSANLSRLVGKMTSDNPRDRPSANTVLTDCDRMLGEESSQEICADVAAICRMKSSQEEGETSQKSTGPTLAEINTQLAEGHVNGVPLHVWNNREGHSHDSDSELADVFNKGQEKNNNNNNKELVDPNLTQDGILYSASTDPSNVTPVTNNTGAQGVVSETLDQQRGANPKNNTCITDLLEQYTAASSQLVRKGSSSGSTSVIRNWVKTPVERRASKTEQSKESSYTCLEYAVNGYHPKGLLVLEDDSLMSDSFDLNGSDFYLGDNDMENNRKMSQSQGVTLGEALDKRDGFLQEAELWAVCRESIKALQKLKKRLPAYISPDTLILREEGFVSFKAIPEDKPLEVMFMAPELQQKGLLSQKTCLYGLAITLRCAIGMKSSAIEPSSDLSHEMESLLKGMLNKDLDKRPPLTEVLAVCDDHEQLSEVPSSAICQFMFQDTATAMMESEAELEMSLSGVQTRAAQQQAELMGQINLHLHGKQHKKPHDISKDSSPGVRNGMECSPAAVVNSPNTTFASPKSNGSAFKPVFGPGGDASQKGIKRVPSKYSSSATHFTPIILHQANTPELAGKPSTVQKTADDRKTGESNSSSRETEVMKKLKELKENLMKPRNGQNKENEGSAQTASRTPPKKPPRPQKNEDTQVNEEKTSSQVSLETIAHLLQNQGQLAQLNMLAATIAQLLQASGYSAHNSPSQTPLSSHNTSFQTSGHIPLTPNMRLPSLDVPQQYQDQLVGQTVTMPVQTSSSMMTNYPVQLQLQQDPRTGLLQLVPIGMMPSPVHSRGSDVDSPSTLPRRGARHQSLGGYSSGSGSPHVRSSDGQSSHTLGRTSRDRIHKSRGKESTRHGPFSTSSREGSLRKAQSEHNLAQVGYEEGLPEGTPDYHPNGHRSGSIPNLTPNTAPSGGSVPPGCILPVHEDGYAYSSSPVWQYGVMRHQGKVRNGDMISQTSVLSNGGSGQRLGGAHRVSPTDSQSSSPSPSKDSGVSGVNSGGVSSTQGYNGYPKTDATLMDRLLGHDSIKQQQVLQKVVALLREAFADDGCLETGGEDYVMAEYITSLAGLKWETFKCAIEEKYHDLIWNPDNLRQLHNTVNRKSSVSKGSVVPDENASMTQEQLDVSGGHVAASTPRGQNSSGIIKPVLSLNHSESKMSETSVDTGEVKSDVARREPCYRYSPTPRGGLHRFNPSRNLYNQGGDTCTSDSTDTSENPERKRRYKKRHQHNRSKNSSLQSSPLDHSNSTQGSNHMESSHADSNHLGVDTEVISRSSSSTRSREATPSRQGSANSSARGQISPTLPRLSEKSSNEEFTRGGNQSTKQPVENGTEDENLPILYSLGVGHQQTDELPIQFTSTPYNMAQQGRAACLNRQESFQNGNVVKRLSYECDNSSNPDNNEVFLEGQSNGLRKSSVSSSRSAHSDSRTEKSVTLNGDSLLQNKSTGSSSRSDRVGDAVRRNRGNVVYHAAELQYCMTPQLQHVIQEMDPKNQSNLESRKSQLDQQVMMERRTKKKMQQFYKKLVDGGKPSKGDHRSMLTQVSKDIKDMTVRLKFMELAWGHVEMLLTELHGISPSLLYSLVTCAPSDALTLTPRPDNPLLQFQIHHDSASNVDVRVLHAGTPDGLMSYLFTMSALADGYVHQFLYAFRYFASQHDLLDFLMNKYVAAKRNVSDPMTGKVMLRAVDLLYFWLEGYYSVDFEKDNELMDKLQEFIINEVTYPDGYGAMLLGLLQDCNHGNNMELSFTGAIVTDEIDLQMRQDCSFSPKKLPGFKAIMKSSPMKTSPAVISSAMLENSPSNLTQEEMFYPHVARRSDAFTITDHSAQSLAEQLCLMQQALFQKCHPVQYLNSKAQGIGVAMAAGGGAKPSASRSRAWSEEIDPNDTGLFEGPFKASPVLQRLIKTGQEISHWVAAEIVSCSSIKSQLSVLTKFIYTAQMCMQMRNFATCVAISDGLENLIVRQLPVWKSLPSKCISIKEELASMKMLLKNEPMCLVEDKEFRDHPTIPSILLFLMHVQQLEIGGFRLANGMFKWPKLRSLAQMIDQIRMFKDQTYQCDLDSDLYDILRHRIRELSCQDLQELAYQHDTNYHKVSVEASSAG
ncbi:kinase non-catalytic C-lobe domain-containing protein 1-like isoform X2 [Liolophura sinensis]|uniref:kinase non-catalytic C-lobe domain-containing protein 1-like isoform X2 n=1 Tax=Liolophura sinensis TaxID=3198878 RepID=UPI003158E80A